jgi:glycosyltransferase involved in cell wall biosynthesis
LNANFTDWRDNPKFIVIYNGVEFSKLEKRVSNPNLLDTFREIGDFILLHIGSMRPEKNHFFMIDCLQWLNKVNPHYKLILIGDGELFPIVKAYVNELELSERVLFVGHEMNIQPYYSDADLFFFPSTNEGFGNVIVEAQYLNLPVCCSNIKPLLESSYNGYHKFVFNPFQISDAVESILKMEENMCKIKEIIVPKAHNYVTSHFSIQNMVNDLTTMYRSLLDEV